MTATNDICAVHDLVHDVHDRAPTDCRACIPIFSMVRPFACLSHTCPDCGRITHALKNDAGELIHDCPKQEL